MITISDTLQAAAEAESRAPVFEVDVLQRRLDFNALYVSPMYVPHRIAEGDGYWIATGYNPVSINTIYYQRFTTLLDESSWDSGWSSLVSGLPDAYIHDLYIDGDDVIVAYWDDGGSGEPELWTISSSNGGQSWGSASLVRDPGYSSSWEVQFVSIIDADIIWWSVGTDGDEVRLLREDSTGYTYFKNYVSSNMFDFMDSATDRAQRQAYARVLLDDRESHEDEFFVFNSMKGFTTGDRWQGVFNLRFYSEHYFCGCIVPALGCMETELDYTFELRGLSRDKFGEFYIGGILEKYNKYADVGGEGAEYGFFICRTRDGKSFDLIPTNIVANDDYDVNEYLFAGFVEDSDGSLVTVATCPGGGTTDCRILYSEPTWISGYDGAWLAIEGDVIDSILINRTVRSSAKTVVSLANSDGAYTGNNVVTEGSVVRVYSGYKTTLGDELQRRFTGLIKTTNITHEPDETVSLDVYDMLSLATKKAGRPHVLFGQNTFRADFSVAGDDEKVVHQSGVWSISGSRLTQTEKLINTFSLCGYDPDDTYTVVAKLRADTSITDVKMGVVVGYDPAELTNRLYTVVCYNQTTNNFEYGYIDSSGSYNLLATLYTSLGWSADTDYWIKIEHTHGIVRGCAFKTSEAGSWTYLLMTQSLEIGPKTYPGLFSYIPLSGTSVSFDRVDVVSFREPLTGSCVMKHLAAAYGIATDEKYMINDAFGGSAFADDWTEGPNGSWTIIAGKAEGTGTVSSPAEACVNTFIANDVVARTYLQLPAGGNYSGVSLRSDCNNNRYEAFVDVNGYIISKVVGGSRTVLDYAYLALWAGSGEWLAVDFAAIGPWLCLFVNGALVGFAYDTDLESGYVGILGGGSTSSNHSQFLVDGFYKPISGLVTVKQDDSMVSVMGQIADLLPGGQFFCNEDGALRWGIFPEDAASDLDVENIILDRQVQRGLDKIITESSIVGNLAYAHARLLPWAIRLSERLWSSEENKLVASGPDLHTIAIDTIVQTHRVTETTLNIRANPALELCDIITIENGTVYLLDTFEDVAATDLTAHDPDIDLEGDGWVRNTGYGTGLIQISATDTATATDNSQGYTIDVGIADYVIEADIKPVNDEVSIIFRKTPGDNGYISVTIDPADDAIYLRQVSSSGTVYYADLIFEAGITTSEWGHIKVVLSGDNIVAFVTIRNITHTLIYFAAGMDSAQTEVGTVLKGIGSEIDNLTVYTPDEKGQILSINEVIGAAYEMAIPDLVGGEEYW